MAAGCGRCSTRNFDLSRRRAAAAPAGRRVERGFDAAFGSALNPLRHLGAIGFLAFWLLAASGVLLYIVLDTSVEGAYRSIASLEQAPLALGWLLWQIGRAHV